MRELRDISAPLPSPGFRERLNAYIAARELRRARRWRLAAGAGLALAGAAAAAAGVFALGSGPAIVDRTVSCSLQVRGGLPFFVLGAGPKGTASVQGKPRPYPAHAVLYPDVNEINGLAGVWAGVIAGYRVDRIACEASTRSVPLATAGLPGVELRRGDAVQHICFGAGRVDVRLRARLDRKGAPWTAKLAVRSRGKTILLVDWTPTLVRVYERPGSCREKVG